MQLTSPVFEHHKPIPPQFTCDGANENPPLSITGVPMNAKSLALVVHDPDAPSKDFVHWTMWNIPPGTNEIKTKQVPPGAVEGRNSFGDSGYGGPCPVNGEPHHYQFDLYALDTTLALAPSATRDELAQAMEGHEVGRTTLVGLYRRG